jgi:catechol 2,3-dioxygenase-like lactoylglutathione lyase family enzyme
MEQTAALEVGLAVLDLERMLGFYADVLGCEEMRRAEIPAALSDALRLADSGYLCVWLRTPGGEVIKLMSPPAPPEVATRPEYLTRVTGYAYLTFYVGDLAAVLTRAERLGGTLRSDRTLTTDAPARGLGVKLAFFEDPEGNVVELVEALAGA